jgi:hypothetical protein
MIQMPSKPVIQAWVEDNTDRGGYALGHLHDTQRTFSIGTDMETIMKTMSAVYETRLRLYRIMDKEWEAKHG